MVTHWAMGWWQTQRWGQNLAVMSAVEALPRSLFLGWCTNLQLLKMGVLAAKVPPSLQTAIRPREAAPQPPPELQFASWNSDEVLCVLCHHLC